MLDYVMWKLFEYSNKEYLDDLIIIYEHNGHEQIITVNSDQIMSPNTNSLDMLPNILVKLAVIHEN